MATIKQIQQELKDEFSFFENWEQKYEYLIEMGKSLSPLETEDKTSDRLIKGCQSQVWLKASSVNGILQLQADSDAILPKGIAALIVRLYDNQPIEEVAQTNDVFFQELGLSEFLSPTRANGTLAMLKQVKLYAIAFQSINKK